MKKTLLIAAAFSFAGFVSCAPTTEVVKGVTVTPMLIKASEGVKRGATATFQGRYLGGPDTGRILIGADEKGRNAFVVSKDAIKSWTDTEIVLTVPENAPAGGSWVFIEVNGKYSTGLKFSVQQ